MKNLVKQLFKENNFDNIQIDNPYDEEVCFFGNYSVEATNFYLVIFLDDMDENFLYERVPRYFEAIKKIKAGYDERIDKNLSMIVCYFEKNDDSPERRNKRCFDIEEDPYYFKKYLIAYSELEVDELNKEFDNKNNLTEFINNIIINSDYFQEFKNEEISNNSTLYKICSKMMIKIPIISLDYRKDELENLSNKINGIMEKQELNELRSVVLNSESILDDNLLEQILNLCEVEVPENE